MHLATATVRYDAVKLHILSALDGKGNCSKLLLIRTLRWIVEMFELQKVRIIEVRIIAVFCL